MNTIKVRVAEGKILRHEAGRVMPNDKTFEVKSSRYIRRLLATGDLVEVADAKKNKPNKKDEKE